MKLFLGLVILFIAVTTNATVYYVATDGSDLIDAGTFVGIDFLGSAPDLGAFEFNIATVVNSMVNNDMNAYFSGDNLIFAFNQTVNQPMYFNLYNLNGQLILNSQIHSETAKNCSGLKHGMYIVKVLSGNKRFINKNS